MAYAMPPAGHAALEFFDPDHFAAIAAGGRLPASLPEAKANAKRICKNPAVRRVSYFVLRANDDVQLVAIGARGGVEILWNFGKGY